MRRLALSLFAVVLAATIGAGWALDRLFADMGGADDEPLAAWRELGRTLADGVRAAGNPAGRIERLAARHDVELARAGDLGLDGGSLLVELQGPRGLALETAHGVTVYYALGDGDALLALNHRTDGAAATPRLLLTLGFYLALLLLVGLWLLPLIRRLDRLVDASGAFGRGELGARVVTSPGSGLYAIESAFNAMAGRIGRLIDDNRLLGRGVAHDLRTPLARLRFGIDFLEELGADDIERRRDHLARLQSDLDAMEDSLDAMLRYARFEARGDGTTHRTIDLTALVTDRIAALGEAVGVAFDRPEAPVLVHGDADQLRTSVDNLLQNARRHGRGRVAVSVREGTDVELRVEDDGDGIVPADRMRVLRPFARGGTATEGSDPPGRASGYGLGLALVVRIADRHGGHVSIGTSHALGGACLRIGLPGLHSRRDRVPEGRGP